MDKLSFQNPLFNTYAIAACIMILKAVIDVVVDGCSDDAG
jgi:hypothetical protein